MCSTHKLALTIGVIPSLNIAAGEQLSTALASYCDFVLLHLHTTWHLHLHTTWHLLFVLPMLTAIPSHTFCHQLMFILHLAIQKVTKQSVHHSSTMVYRWTCINYRSNMYNSLHTYTGPFNHDNASPFTACMMCCRSTGFCLCEGMGCSWNKAWPQDAAIHCSGKHCHPDHHCVLLWHCFLWRFCHILVQYDPHRSADSWRHLRFVIFLQPVCQNRLFSSL